MNKYEELETYLKNSLKMYNSIKKSQPSFDKRLRSLEKTIKKQAVYFWKEFVKTNHLKGICAVYKGNRYTNVERTHMATHSAHK